MDESTFDVAAEKAKKEMQERIANNPETAEAFRIVTKWFEEFYRSAGHKRLGRILVELAGGR
jgi:hypothetical protein